jgi:hypothetical protein
MGLFGAGIRFLLDQHQRWTRAGLPVYLRVKNFDDSGDEYVKLGFQIAPTGGQITGFDDILIQPPPEVREVSMHNIGLNQSRLRFGAKYFIISHSFVLKRMQDTEYMDASQVWSDPSLVGLLYDNRLFEIVSINHDETAGETISWTLVCNGSDTLLTVT